MTSSTRVMYPRMPRGPRQERRYTERPRQQGLVQRAVVEAFRKLDPRLPVANPVMFVVWCGTALCLALTLEPRLLDAEAGARERGFNALISLTQREREVLACLAAGDNNRAIAQRLGIGEGTVRSHVHVLLQKLQVSNRTQAALIWLAGERQNEVTISSRSSVDAQP
jgi:DNA-binding CsgD family transcriptional regulator